MLTFEFYVENGGKLGEVDFKNQLRLALNYIDYVTFGRLFDYDDADNRLKFLLFDMIELQNEHENSPEISGHSTGSASVSFNVSAPRTLAQKQFDISNPVLSRIFVDGVRSNFRG